MQVSGLSEVYKFTSVHSASSNFSKVQTLNLIFWNLRVYHGWTSKTS